MPPIAPADRYEPAGDLWLLTCLFNPASYRSRLENYRAFRRPIDAGRLNLVTVECVFGESPFALEAYPDVVRVRARHVLWHKERLLSLALDRLPPECTKVAWLDCDVLFANPSWAVETSRLLDHLALVQPFDTAVRLGQGESTFERALEWDERVVYPSYTRRLATTPEVAFADRYSPHGHTGYAWAARRDVIARTGFYDRLVLGGGDHAMAHAAGGGFDASCLVYRYGAGSPILRHYGAWAREFHENVRDRIGYTPGTLLHLWHGDIEDRGYTRRDDALRDHAFDPETDLRLGDSGCYEWATDKPELHAWVERYFESRREDAADEPVPHP